MGFEEGAQAIDAESGCMFGGWGQSSDCVLYFIGGDLSDRREWLSVDEFRQGRTRCDGRRTAAHPVADLRNEALCKRRGEAKDIATRRIAHLHRNGGRGQFAHMAGIAEMVKQCIAVHASSNHTGEPHSR